MDHSDDTHSTRTFGILGFAGLGLLAAGSLLFKAKDRKQASKQSTPISFPSYDESYPDAKRMLTPEQYVVAKAEYDVWLQNEIAKVLWHNIRNSG